MRITLLILSLAGLALAGDPARVTSPVLGYVFDPASKSMRLIAGSELAGGIRPSPEPVFEQPFACRPLWRPTFLTIANKGADAPLRVV